jgi:hypothetical protein
MTMKMTRTHLFVLRHAIEDCSDARIVRELDVLRAKYDADKAAFARNPTPAQKRRVAAIGRDIAGYEKALVDFHNR